MRYSSPSQMSNHSNKTNSHDKLVLSCNYYVGEVSVVLCYSNRATRHKTSPIFWNLAILWSISCPLKEQKAAEVDPAGFCDAQRKVSQSSESQGLSVLLHPPCFFKWILCPTQTFKFSNIIQYLFYQENTARYK